MITRNRVVSGLLALVALILCEGYTTRAQEDRRMRRLERGRIRRQIYRERWRPAPPIPDRSDQGRRR
jgi:hypothetical protein